MEPTMEEKKARTPGIETLNESRRDTSGENLRNCTKLDYSQWPRLPASKHV